MSSDHTQSIRVSSKEMSQTKKGATTGSFNEHSTPKGEVQMEEYVEVERLKDEISQDSPLIFGRKPVTKKHPLYVIKREVHTPAPERGVDKMVPVKFDKDWIILTPVNTIAPTTELSVAAKADYMMEEKKIFQGFGVPEMGRP